METINLIIINNNTGKELSRAAGTVDEVLAFIDRHNSPASKAFRMKLGCDTTAHWN